MLLLCLLAGHWRRTHRVPNSYVHLRLTAVLFAVLALASGSYSQSLCNGVPVTAPAGAVSNSPRAVLLTSPAGGSIFGAAATVAMGAAATDGDGSVARVDFYAGSTRVGSDTTSPYTFSWGNVAAGSCA
jgi:hypothetical protein